jgi:hypothetical protein
VPDEGAGWQIIGVPAQTLPLAQDAAVVHDVAHPVDALQA